MSPTRAACLPMVTLSAVELDGDALDGDRAVAVDLDLPPADVDLSGTVDLDRVPADGEVAPALDVDRLPVDVDDPAGDRDLAATREVQRRRADDVHVLR